MQASIHACMRHVHTHARPSMHISASTPQTTRARRAVHCGTDLASAANNVLGYNEPDMKRKKST